MSTFTAKVAAGDAHSKLIIQLTADGCKGEIYLYIKK